MANDIFGIFDHTCEARRVARNPRKYRPKNHELKWNNSFADTIENRYVQEWTHIKRGIKNFSLRRPPPLGQEFQSSTLIYPPDPRYYARTW